MASPWTDYGSRWERSNGKGRHMPSHGRTGVLTCENSDLKIPEGNQPGNGNQCRPAMYCATALISPSDMRKAIRVMISPSLVRVPALKASNCFSV